MAKIYALSNESYLRDDLVKIGLTTNLDRRKEQLQAGQPFPLESIANIEVPEGYTRHVEKFLHKILDPLRLSKGEWFRIPRGRVESLFKKTGDLIKAGHVLDGLEHTLAIYDEMLQITAGDGSSGHGTTQFERQQRTRSRNDDFRNFVPDGTTLRYGMTEHYCVRKGDGLVTDDGQTHSSLTAAANHIQKQRGGKGNVDGWLQLRIRRGNEWVKLRSLRKDLPDPVRNK